MNLEQRARNAEGLSDDTKRKLMVHGGCWHSTDRPENASGWPLWVCICLAAAIAIMAVYFWVAW